MGELNEFERIGQLLGAAGGPAAPATSGPDASHGNSAGDSPGSQSPDPVRLVAVIWPDVMGAEVGANSRPLQLKRGRLVVSASSSAWAQTLQLMSESIIARLNERLGSGTVERVVFRQAGWEEHPRRGARKNEVEPGAVGVLSPEQLQALAQVEKLDLPRDLREAIARAMKAAFVRGEQDFVR